MPIFGAVRGTVKFAQAVKFQEMLRMHLANYKNPTLTKVTS